jgi:hypothetical protein
VFAAVERGATDSLIAPSFRLEVEATIRRGATAGHASGTFDWYGGRASACPIRLGFGNAWRVAPCASFEIGRIGVNGVGLADPKSPSDWWLALGAALRVGYAPWRHFSAELEGGLTFPLRRDSFTFDKSGLIFAVPPVGGAIAAGASVLFL